MNRNLIIAGVLVFVLGYGGGFFHGKLFTEDKLIGGDSVPESTSFIGKITEVKGQSLTVEGPASPSSFVEWPKLREVSISAGTAILSITANTNYGRELARYGERLLTLAAGDPNPPVPPSQTIQKELKLSDLKPGMTVMVFSDKSIGSRKKITATKIEVQDVYNPGSRVEGSALLPGQVVAPIIGPYNPPQ